MTPVARGIDRVVTAAVALVLLAAGGWAIAYRVNLRVARDWAAHIQPQALPRATEWSWWAVALGGASIVATLLGVWLLLLHLRVPKARNVSGESGAVDLDRIAQAIAEVVERHPALQSAKASTRIERGRPVMRITAQLTPHTSAAEVHRLARGCANDARRAAGADFEFQLLVRSARPEQSRPQVM